MYHTNGNTFANEKGVLLIIVLEQQLETRLSQAHQADTSHHFGLRRIGLWFLIWLTGQRFSDI